MKKIFAAATLLLAMTACGGSRTKNLPLEGTSWKLSRMETIPASAIEAEADAFIRIHANGSPGPSVHGMMTLCMTPQNPWNADLYEKSRALSDAVLFTGCIDEYFEYCFGRLEYRSLRFDHRVLETDNFQGNAVVNYTERSIPYTRIIEHKHFAFGTQPTTVVTYEYPDDFAPGKEPYYPVNDERNSRIYDRYRTLADNCVDVLFGGRLAQYTYADMDDTVEAALRLSEEVLR